MKKLICFFVMVVLLSGCVIVSPYVSNVREGDNGDLKVEISKLSYNPFGGGYRSEVVHYKTVKTHKEAIAESKK
jgi:hypothetical protein